MPQQPPTIHLRGAWTGAIDDPHRAFHGSVTAADLPGFKVGSRVTVTYHTAEGRVPDANEHGGYTLKSRAGTLTLMSFTCQSARTTGPGGHDDTQDAAWQAVPLPK